VREIRLGSSWHRTFRGRVNLYIILVCRHIVKFENPCSRHALVGMLLWHLFALRLYKMEAVRTNSRWQGHRMKYKQ
jgi:hypothetical protein